MTPPESREPRAWLLMGLAVLIVASIYAQVLGAPFVWDDRHLILDSQIVRHVDVIEAFTERFWIGAPEQAASFAYFRPLTTLSFAVDYQLHAHNPAGYHLTNLVLHLVAMGLLMGLLRRRGASVALMFVLGLLWALLPRLTEAAAWISGRGDVLAGVLTFAALLVHRPGSGGRLVLASLLAFGALLSKESGIAALVALALLEGSGEGPSPLRQRAQRLLALAVPLALYVALRVRAGALSPSDSVALTSGERVVTALEAAGRYAFMLVNPFQPRSFLGRLGHLNSLFVVLGVLALLGLLALAPRFRRLTPAAHAFLALGLIPLLLVLHLFPLPFISVTADRYLYLPIAGLLVVLLPAARALLAARPKLMLGLLLVTGLCGVRTFQRIGDYTDEALFWRQAVETAPGHAIPSIELGSVAYRAGLFPEALALCQEALKLDDLGSGRALDNAALLAAVMGKRELSARLGDALVARFPDNVGYRMRRASVALNAFDFEIARVHAERGLALNPGSVELRRLLDLIGRAQVATLDPRAPAALIQSFDIQAQRFPEVTRRLSDQLRTGTRTDETLVREGLELLIARGDPRVAQQQLKLYVEQRSKGHDHGIPAELVDSWERALGFRLETASLVLSQLRLLTPRSTASH